MSGFTPVFCESIQEVICFEQRWEVIDLDHMAELICVDAHALVNGIIIVDVLDGKSRGFFQMCSYLTGKTQRNGRTKQRKTH